MAPVEQKRGPIPLPRTARVPHEDSAPDTSRDQDRLTPFPMVRIDASDDVKTQQYTAKQIATLVPVTADEDDACTVLRSVGPPRPLEKIQPPASPAEVQLEQTPTIQQDPPTPAVPMSFPLETPVAGRVPPPAPAPSLRSALPPPAVAGTLRSALPPAPVPPRLLSPPPARPARTVPPPAPSRRAALETPTPPVRAAMVTIPALHREVVPPRDAAFAAAHMPPRSRPPASLAPVAPPEESPRSRVSSIAPLAGTVPPPPFAPRRFGRLLLAALSVGALALTAGLLDAFGPKTGTLVVSASGGPRGESVEVFVDGEKRCSQTPCTLADVAAGSHLIRATMAGHTDTAERAVVVEGGATATHHVAFGDVVETAGLRVAAEGEGLRVWVDGTDLGAPPVRLDAVPPGAHVVRVVGKEGEQAPYEERIDLHAGEVRSLGPVRLKSLVVEAPADSEVAEAAEVVKAEVPKRVSSRPAVRRVARNIAPRAPAKPKPSAVTKVASGQGVLNVNSIPVSSVVVDGRPLGLTPVRGLVLKEGPHTVVFIHPQHGRKIVRTNVPAGGKTTALTRF